MLADSAVSSLILAIICALFISAHFAVVRRFIYSTYDIIAQLSLSLALSVIAILVYSSILASLECFTSQAFAILLLIHTVSIATWIRLKRPVTKVPPAGWDGWHAALILFVLVCYWPAAKIYVGGQDPAVYVAAASSLAHHGKARAPSTAHSLLTPEESQDLLHISADVRHYHWVYKSVDIRHSLVGKHL